MVKLSDLRKKTDQDSDQDNWQLSLADMMTLLLCFFVLIVSVSRLDPNRFDKVAASLEQAMTKERPRPEPAPKQPEAVAKAPAGEVRTKAVKTVIEAPAGERVSEKAGPRKKSMAELKKELEDKFAGRKGLVDLTPREDGVAIGLRGAAFFDLASAELSPQAAPVLAEIADALRDAPYHFTIEGHTDNLPIESWIYPSNWELSSARASRVARFLIERGVPKDDVKVEGLADVKPMLPNTDANGNPIPENQARNRRVVILVSP